MLLLLFSFFKIGLFSFGGGYAMLPLIQAELLNNGWMSASKFTDIIVISQITPGPISINTATYVGYELFGFIGSFLNTVSVSIPSATIALLVAMGFEKFKQNKNVDYTIKKLRPISAGLIAAAALFFIQMSLFEDMSLYYKDILNSITRVAPDYKAILIFAASFIVMKFTKINSLFIIIAAGISGVLF